MSTHTGQIFTFSDHEVKFVFTFDGHTYTFTTTFPSDAPPFNCSSVTLTVGVQFSISKAAKYDCTIGVEKLKLVFDDGLGTVTPNDTSGATTIIGILVNHVVPPFTFVGVGKWSVGI